MRNMFKIIGYILAFILRGFERFFTREPEVVVLMYHAIDDSGWKHAITPHIFRAQLTFLVEHMSIVPLADVVAHAKGDRLLTRDSVALTFDDGYQKLLAVIPELMEKKIPITLFIPSDTNMPTNTAKSPRMSWDDIRMVAKDPLVSVEAHGRTHRRLTALTDVERIEEVRGCADEIEREIGKRPSYFAYPYGDKDPEVVAVTRDTGYEAAFAITEGTIRPGDNLFTLKRIQVDNTMNPLLFRMRLTRAVDIHRRIVDFLGLR